MRSDSDGSQPVSSAEPDGQDPLDGDPRLPELFGSAWSRVRRFHALLRDEGVIRGLVGPRELGRLWERHLVNSAAVVPFLPDQGRIVDVGSGAGLPGLVVAAMLPDAEVILVEPMERRTDWLAYVIDHVGMPNVQVLGGRAEDVGELDADAVTARAVAALAKLYPWTLPLCRVGGKLVALKGGRAADEIADGAEVATRCGGGVASLETAPKQPGLEPTSVVIVEKIRAVPQPAGRAVPRETSSRSRTRRTARKGQRR